VTSDDFVPSWQPPAFPNVEEALSADCVVVEEHGRWIVYLDAVLASGAVRRKVGEHHDQRRALHAARIFERNVRRCITVPQGPSRLPEPEPLRLTTDDPSKGHA
jgi:hypothetical protein